jgi:aminoglycoside phosphotransferase (APT) family kinase protein
VFISKKEKADIESRLLTLEARVVLLARSLNALHDIKTISSKTSSLRRVKKTKEEKLEARRIYAREYYARKQAEKVQS